MNGKNLEGSGSGIIEVLTQHFSSWAEENHEKPQSGQPVSRLRFEPNTSLNISLDRYLHEPLRLK
jgi:hypothetical protein